MKCFAGGGGRQSEQFVAFPFSSLSPLLMSLLTPHILHPRRSLSHIPAIESFGSDRTLRTLF